MLNFMLHEFIVYCVSITKATATENFIFFDLFIFIFHCILFSGSQSMFLSWVPVWKSVRIFEEQSFSVNGIPLSVDDQKANVCKIGAQISLVFCDRNRTSGMDTLPLRRDSPPGRDRWKTLLIEGVALIPLHSCLHLKACCMTGLSVLSTCLLF